MKLSLETTLSETELEEQWRVLQELEEKIANTNATLRSWQPFFTDIMTLAIPAEDLIQNPKTIPGRLSAELAELQETYWKQASGLLSSVRGSFENLSEQPYFRVSIDPAVEDDGRYSGRTLVKVSMEPVLTMSACNESGVSRNPKMELLALRILRLAREETAISKVIGAQMLTAAVAQTQLGNLGYALGTFAEGFDPDASYLVAALGQTGIPAYDMYGRLPQIQQMIADLSSELGFAEPKYRIVC